MALMVPKKRYPNARESEATHEYDFQPSNKAAMTPQERQRALLAKQSASVRAKPAGGLMGAARFGVSNAQPVGPQPTSPSASPAKNETDPREFGQAGPIPFEPGTRMVEMPGGYWAPSANGVGVDISEFVNVPNANGQGGHYIPRSLLPADWRPGMGLGRTSDGGYEAQEYQPNAVYGYSDYDYNTGAPIAGNFSSPGAAPPAPPSAPSTPPVTVASPTSPAPSTPTNPGAPSNPSAPPASPPVATTPTSGAPSPNPPTGSSGGLIGAPTSAPPGSAPTSGLPLSPPTGASTGTGTPTGNTAPVSTPGFVPTYGTIPGATGVVGQQRVDDQFQFFMDALNARNRVELGGITGPGGNNLAADGSYNIPEWLQSSGLMAQWNQGANTDAQTRQVQEGETVEGRLAGLMGSDNELNRIAMENAREQAAASGMLGGSSAAAGAALRASREAMLPVAQQDAAWYGQTAAQNMDAVNRDRLSDQDLRTNLLGQSQQIRANLYEAASDRRWKSKEANYERMWNSFENNMAYLRGSVDREDTQNFTAWQSGLERDFRAFTQMMDQQFQGTEAERNRVFQSSQGFFNSMFGREGTMASILSGIYSNPNLTPAQQQAAAENARSIMGNLWNSFNLMLAQGVPRIFQQWYPYTGQQAPTLPSNPAPPPATGTPPPSGGGGGSNPNDPVGPEIPP